MRSAERRDERGYALIEAVVALMVIGLVSMLLLETVRFASAGYARAETAAADAQGEARTTERLRAMIAAAEAMQWRDETGARFAVFDGRRDRLVLVLPAARAAPAGLDELPTGLAVVEIAAAKASGGEGVGDGWALVLRRAPFGRRGGEGATLERETETETLIARLGSVRLRYLARDPEAPLDTPTLWRDAWRSAEALPELIRLDIVEAGGRVWPPIVAAPRQARAAAP